MKRLPRKLAALAVLAVTCAPAFGQTSPPLPDRYGIPANPEAYPQDSPQAVLASTIKALERGRYDYFTAFLLDPQLADAKVLERAKPLEEQTELDLRTLRDLQRGAPIGTQRLPLEPGPFAEAVRNEANLRAFRLVARDIREFLAEHPDHLRELQRFRRSGQLSESGEEAKLALPDVNDRALFFRRVSGRWHILDQKQEPDDPAGRN